MNTYYVLEDDDTWKEITKRQYDDFWYQMHKPEILAAYGDQSHFLKISRGQNKSNRKPNKNKPFKGVTIQRGKYVARFEGKYLGRFAIDTDAARAYDKATIEKYGDNAVTNFTRR